MSPKKDLNITQGVLSCGLRFVHIYRDTVAEIFGTATKVGSRDELPGQYGLAHFVEHTIFKGTPTRRASSIINCMETVGGELNAYTTKEETYVYSIFPQGNVSRAVKIIGDLVNNSSFPDNELDKEREVVSEEIDSYLDTPSEAVFDDFEDLIFAGTPLGHNILGNSADLAGFDSRVCREFLHRYYRPDNMVAFYIGSESPDKIYRLLETQFPGKDAVSDAGQSENTCHTPGMSQGALSKDSHALNAPFYTERGDGSNHQGHTVMGVVIPSMYSPGRQIFALVNNILGGPGMNSRLNVSLRERRGLVYSVESSLAMYSDCGLMTIYFGCNPEDTARCKKLVARELQKLVIEGITETALRRAKRQYIGQLAIATASTEQTILSAARSLLFRNEVIPVTAAIDAIQSLTADDISRVASYLDPSNFSSLTLT